MEQRPANVQIGKPGGNSSKGAVTYKLTLPVPWIKEWNVSPDDRTVKLTFTDDKKIIIEKA